MVCEEMGATQKEALQKSLNVIHMVMNIFRTMQAKPLNWSVSFGSLLNLMRDRGNLSGDIDLSVVDEDVDTRQIVESYTRYGYVIANKIIDHRSGKYLFASLEPMKERNVATPIGIDLFFWAEIGNSYYHTYDVAMEKPKDGIPGKYVFKGVRKKLFDAGTTKVRWPHMPYEVNIPVMAGSLLDLWYPLWYIPDPNFGQSMSDQIFKTKSLVIDVKSAGEQLEQSKREYDEKVERMCRR